MLQSLSPNNGQLPSLPRPHELVGSGPPAGAVHCAPKPDVTAGVRRRMSLAGGAERHLEVESLSFLEVIDHLKKIASLRIAWDPACASDSSQAVWSDDSIRRTRLSL